MTANRGGKELDQAFEGLEQELPDRPSRAIRWLRDLKTRWTWRAYENAPAAADDLFHFGRRYVMPLLRYAVR